MNLQFFRRNEGAEGPALAMGTSSAYERSGRKSSPEGSANGCFSFHDNVGCASEKQVNLLFARLARHFSRSERPFGGQQPERVRAPCTSKLLRPEVAPSAACGGVDGKGKLFPVRTAPGNTPCGPVLARPRINSFRHFTPIKKAVPNSFLRQEVPKANDRKKE